MIITISDTDAQKLITKIQPGLGEKHHPTKLQPLYHLHHFSYQYQYRTKR